MYLRTCSNSKPTVDTAYPRAQKCSPVKFRSLPHKRAIAMALFPFRNPITEATGYFGGIAMHMCTWSGSRCPLNDLALLLPRQGVEYFSQLAPCLAKQHLAPSLWHKHHMILTVPTGMR